MMGRRQVDLPKGRIQQQKRKKRDRKGTAAENMDDPENLRTLKGRLISGFISLAYLSKSISLLSSKDCLDKACQPCQRYLIETTHSHPKQTPALLSRCRFQHFLLFSHCVPFCLAEDETSHTTVPTIGSSPSFSEAAERLLEPSPNKEIIDSKENGLSTAERME
ncbi:hypothetical protein AVEN_214104-1 [Araneus ventricosus]|uniref:Uncharacterized protein n=1 Tax=Araneus ventricosus TaxID=182803 RepID=A0A4Y2C8E2_ARAVE|nr:hypothetical protein AVEN_214104-1 [Araneus ventricosus]